jgi:hypothetical protein
MQQSPDIEPTALRAIKRAIKASIKTIDLHQSLLVGKARKGLEVEFLYPNS